MRSTPQVLEVWGEFACFTRPELKVERFSYPVITPSAARGIFDAIYRKPKEFRWQITRIQVLREPQYIALRRNEVKEKASTEAVLRWMSGGEEPVPIYADGDRELLGTDAKGRTQRQTMALKDVRYRLTAEVRPWPGFEPYLRGCEEQFRRRAESGKCSWQPYFGCREFPAYFELVPGDQPPDVRLAYTQELGWMLYDCFDLSRPGGPTDRPSVSVFHARVVDGVLEVPEFGSPDVRRLL